MDLKVNILTDSDLKASQLSDFGDVVLKPYQLSEIYRMRAMESGQYEFQKSECHTSIGILGSKVGSGKTLSCIGLIRSFSFPEKMVDTVVKYKSTSRCNMRVVQKIERRSFCPATLVVVPHNLYNQWKEELDRTKTSWIASTDIPRDFDYSKIESNVVLCRSTDYVRFVGRMHYRQKYVLRWKRMILDEADNNLISAMPEVEADFVWFVTYTFSNLYLAYNIRRRGFIYDIFSSNKVHSWDNDIFASIVVKSSDDYIRDTINLPSLTNHRHMCKTPYYIQIANRYMSSNITAKINAGNVDEAIQDMGGEITDGDVVEVFIRNREKDIQRLETKLANIGMWYPTMNVREREDKKIELERKVSEIRKVIDCISQNTAKLREQECPICECEYETPTMIDCCGTLFCIDCIEQALDMTQGCCPKCSVSGVSMANVKLITDKTDKADKPDKADKLEPKPSAPVLLSKEKTVLNIIKQKRTSRVIIFSSYDETFHRVTKELFCNGIVFSELKGTMAHYQRTLDRFKDGSIQVLMLNTKFNAAGLNITCATDIIIYHRLPNDIEQQVIGRGQRIGRRGSLNVHYLEYANEY